MIALGTRLTPADNSGAKVLRVLGTFKRSKWRFVTVGDVVRCSVQKVDPSVGSLEKGQKVTAVIVRTRKEIKRDDGSYIRFDDNAAVVIEKQEPVGTRVFGPVARELKELGYSKIVSLASEVL